MAMQTPHTLELETPRRDHVILWSILLKVVAREVLAEHAVQQPQCFYDNVPQKALLLRGFPKPLLKAAALRGRKIREIVEKREAICPVAYRAAALER